MSVVCNDLVRHSFSFTCCCCLSACGACSPIPGCRLYRPRGTLFQPLLDCAGPVPPSVSVVCTDLSGRSFSVTIGRCLSVCGRCPRPRVSSVPIRAGRFFRCCLSVRGLYLLPRVSYVRIRAGRVFCRCLSTRGLYSIPQTSFVPTSRDSHSVSHPVAALVRGACTPFRGRRQHRPRGNLFQPPLECAGPVPASASVVCTDREGRSLRFTCC